MKTAKPIILGDFPITGTMRDIYTLFVLLGVIPETKTAAEPEGSKRRHIDHPTFSETSPERDRPTPNHCMP